MITDNVEPVVETPGPERLGRRSLAALALTPLASRAWARRDDQPVQPTTITLGWRGAPIDVALLIARDQGLFAGSGLNVILKPGLPSGSDLAGAMRAGQIAGCVGPIPLLLGPVHDGLDARFTTGVAGGGLRLLAERRSGLRHVTDMTRRTIGVVDPQGAARLFFSVLFRRKGIDPAAAVTWHQLDASQLGPALLAGTVDAVAVADPDAFALREAMRLTEIATNLSGGYRDRAFTALLLSGALLRGARRDDAARLTRAIRQAAGWAADHVEAAAGIAQPLAPALTPIVRARMLGSEALGLHPTGSALVDDVAAYVDELRLLGALPYQLNATRFARGACDDVGRG